jgi:hypothetical protein
VQLPPDTMQMHTVAAGPARPDGPAEPLVCACGFCNQEMVELKL